MRLGTGPAVIRLPRRFAIEAVCKVLLSCPDRTYEEAEDLFCACSGTVKDRFPEIVLEITELYEED